MQDIAPIPMTRAESRRDNIAFLTELFSATLVLEFVISIVPKEFISWVGILKSRFSSLIYHYLFSLFSPSVLTFPVVNNIKNIKLKYKVSIKPCFYL